MPRNFEIFTKPPAASIAVKRGFSWPGFFFLWIWAFFQGLWLEGALVLLVDALILALKLTILAPEPVLCVFLSLALGIVVGLRGNFWRSRKLEHSGYNFAALVPANSASRAVSSYKRGDISKSTGAHFSGIPFSLPGGLQKILAIAWLTWKAALRFRLFAVVAALLVLAVVGLPLVVKDDGTARGFIQIIITYTLTAVTVLLGFSTLWLSCGALARDIEECQIQVVATKPIARWQIWLGKWIGIASLNAVLLVLAAICIYGLLEWRATKLSPAEQMQLRDELLVARGSAKEASHDAEIDAETERILAERRKENPVSTAFVPEVRREIREQVKSDYELVPPGYSREWKIDLGTSTGSLRDKPLQLKIKFDAANRSPQGTYIGLWEIGNPDSTNFVMLAPMSLAPETFHEFSIPPNLCDPDGKLDITFVNQNSMSLIFPLEDGMEVFYPQGGFALNFVRALGIIFCWLILLSAIGLMSASFLSFPVAAFFSLTMLAMAFSSSALAETVELGSVTTGTTPTPQTINLTDKIFIPIFKGLLEVLNIVENFSPISDLSAGQSVPWSELGAAFSQIVLLCGGLFAIIGIALFSRRELAAAQNQ